METPNLADNRGQSIPIINIAPLICGTEDRRVVAEEIGRACRDCGFFYVVGHGVDVRLQEQLERLSQQFFAQDIEAKMEIRMRETVLEYLSAMTQLGHQLMAGIALSPGLEESYFFERYTGDPLLLFRIFNYPAQPTTEGWGAGEHTDYGLLTILKQDEAGGLQVKSQSRWIEAPPIPGSFVCNIGDMLDRMTAGRYRSTPHRVRNLSGRDRLSFPFFFDPNFNAAVAPIQLGESRSLPLAVLIRSLQKNSRFNEPFSSGFLHAQLRR
jgi:isopenicillin N synthase-like dioxygenase